MAYVPLADDTTKAAEQRQFEMLRQAGGVSRLALCAKLSRRTKELCLSGLRRRESDPVVIRQKFARSLLGVVPAFEVWGDVQMWIQDSVELAQHLHPLLEGAGIFYYVTGGVAASYHGDPRATRDLDVVVQIDQGNIDSLVALLSERGFYVPEGAVEEVRRGVGKTINVTHQETLANADILASPATPFDDAQMSRRELADVGFYVCSAEDAILQKLRWSQRSLSEKQWRDVQGIVRMQRDALDLNYLYGWAEQIGVSERLRVLFEESEL